MERLLPAQELVIKNQVLNPGNLIPACSICCLKKRYGNNTLVKNRRQNKITVVRCNSQQPLTTYEGKRKHILSLEIFKAQGFYPLVR